MKKILKIGVLLSTVTVVALFGALEWASGTSEIIICHRTGSNTEGGSQYNLLTPDTGATSGHENHEGDIIVLNPSPSLLQAAHDAETSHQDTAFCQSLLQTTTTAGGPTSTTAPAQTTSTTAGTTSTTAGAPTTTAAPTVPTAPPAKAAKAAAPFTG